MHNKLPQYVQRIAFHQNCTIHDYNTRRQNELHITRTYHEYAKRCNRHNIPRTINNTTVLIKNKIHTHSQTGFLTYMQKCIIYDCTKNIVKLQTVSYLSLYCTIKHCINNIIVVITLVLVDRIVCF